jgi:hypothetical protein
MVATPIIIESNARFAAMLANHSVCVFASATSGIGLAALNKLAIMLRSCTFTY